MLNLQNLTKHTGVGRSYVVKVSMSQRGLISISDGAVRRYNLQDKDWAVLYFDAENRIVAIQPLIEKADDAMKLRHRDTGAYIAASSFMGNFQIDLTKTTAYALKRDDESGFLYFELDGGKERKSREKGDL